MTDVETQTASSARLHESTPRWLVGALSLGALVGLGVGWVGHELQVKLTKQGADAAVQGEGDQATGPCKTWADTICTRMGKTAYECKVAQGATALLSGSACAQAQQGMQAKIDVLEAQRAPCTELSSKLCGDLGADGKGCELIVAKEPGIAPRDCKDMMGRYEQTLAQLMSRQTKGTLPEVAR